MLTLIILLSRFLNIVTCTYLLNTSRKEKLDGKKQFFLWFAGCRGAMAFALSIKSIIDFPENGKIFLVLTLIIALFTLLYSTLFLDCTLKKCGITDFCDADNFDQNILSKNPNCFDRFKVSIMNFNENYFKKCIKIPEDLNSNVNSSVDSIGVMEFYKKKMENKEMKNLNINTNNNIRDNSCNNNDREIVSLESRKSLELDNYSEADINFNSNLSKKNLNDVNQKDYCKNDK